MFVSWPTTHRSLRLEALEPRVLLSAAQPSAWDQYLLELINRARSDPAAEAARFGIGLNEGVAPEDTISPDPKQPLAMNLCLVDAAQDHSQWMLATDTFSHTGAGGSSPGDRMADAGYPFVPPWGWGENIALYKETPTVPEMTWATAQLHRNLFVDENYPGRGHRLNILDPDFREVGTGVAAGDWGGWNAVVCTEDFAYSGSSVFLTGVAYDDSVTDDDFYTPGEGLGGVVVEATRQSDAAYFSTTTWTAGGYSLALPPGTYDVVASGGGLGGAVAINGVLIGAENVKLDFTPDMLPAEPLLVVTDDQGQADDHQVAFGDVPALVGSVSHSVTLTNTGTDDLTITSITLDDLVNFSVAWDGDGNPPALIAPGASRVATLTFDPVCEGNLAASFTIASDAANDPNVVVALTGNGTGSPDRFEDNDTSATATDLGQVGVADEQGLSIDTCDDTDWFHFVLRSQGEAGDQIEVLFTHSMGNIDARLYDDPAGAPLASATSLADNETIPLDGLAAGDYYLEVFTQGQATNIYDLLIEATDIRYIGSIPVGDNAQVYVFDCDDVADVALANVAVRAGRGDAVSSITLVGDQAMSGLGLVVRGATSVGSIRDYRRGPLGQVAFVAVDAPLRSLRLKTGMGGYNLNGAVLGGLAFPADLDGDGDQTDPTALWTSGDLRYATVYGDLDADVVVPNATSLTVRGNLAGQTTATGFFRRLYVYGDWSGDLSAQWVWYARTRGSLTADIELNGAYRGVSLRTLRAGRVVGSEVNAPEGIRYVAVTDWAGGSITAGWLGTLRATGNRRDGIPGHFGADITLSGNGTTGRTLGSARIAGQLPATTWDITGAVGYIRAAGADGWTLDLHSQLRTLVLGETTGATISVGGELRYARLGATTNTTLQADSIRTLILGDADGLTLEVAGPLNYLRAVEWEGGSLSAHSLRTLRITGSRREGLAGDFSAPLTLTGNGVAPGHYVLRSASIRGSVSDGPWNIGGAVGTLYVYGDFAGDLTALSVRSMTVRGDLDGATLTLTQAVQDRVYALGRLYVGGWMRDAAVDVAGNIATVYVRGIEGSRLFAGVGGEVLPTAPGDFGAQATIRSFTQAGIRENGVYIASFVDSDVAAWNIRRCSLRQVEMDNGGEAFGVAASDIGVLTWRQDGTTHRYPPRRPTDWPADPGDLSVTEV